MATGGCGGERVMVDGFVSTLLSDSRRLRTVAVLNKFTEDALAIDLYLGIKRKKVVDVKVRISSTRGIRPTIRMDS